MASVWDGETGTVLPVDAGLTSTVERDGEVVAEGPLQAALEPEAGFHYGVADDEVVAGDALTLRVDSPPQASRHESYETAFLEIPDVELTVE